MQPLSFRPEAVVLYNCIPVGRLHPGLQGLADASPFVVSRVILSDYMTYFYEESLSANDKIFLRRITDKRGADFEYLLKEVQKVIASPVLRVVDFAEEETLNFDLLNGILDNQGIPKYQEYLTTLIQQLKEKKQIDFISRYYDSDKFMDIFIVKLNEQWTDFFSYIVHNKAISGEQIRNYSLDTLRLSEELVVSQMNFDNSLSDYISHQEDYLNIQNAYIDNVISKFEILHVSFKSLNYEKSDKGLFDKVYEHNLYDMTFENIELMLRTKCGITSLYDIKHKNYTIIKGMQDSPLAQYVDANMQLYLEEVIENCEDRIEDDETKAVLMLTHDFEPIIDFGVVGKLPAEALNAKFIKNSKGSTTV